MATDQDVFRAHLCSLQTSGRCFQEGAGERPGGLQLAEFTFFRQLLRDNEDNLGEKGKSALMGALLVGHRKREQDFRLFRSNICLEAFLLCLNASANKYASVIQTLPLSAGGNGPTGEGYLFYFFFNKYY